MTERFTVEGHDPGPWTSVTDALDAGRSFTEEIAAAAGVDYNPGREALAAVEAELNRARETLTELAESVGANFSEELRARLTASTAALRQHAAAAEEYAADLRAMTEWTDPGFPVAPVALGPSVVSDAHDLAAALAEDVAAARGLLTAVRLTVEHAPTGDSEDVHTDPSGSFLPGVVLDRKNIADRLRDVHRWRTNLRREARRRRDLTLQDGRPPGRGCSTPRRPVHRCRPRYFTRSSSTDDPAPSRWQGALVGAPTSPGWGPRESRGVPT